MNFTHWLYFKLAMNLIGMTVFTMYVVSVGSVNLLHEDPLLLAIAVGLVLLQAVLAWKTVNQLQRYSERRITVPLALCRRCNRNGDFDGPFCPACKEQVSKEAGRP